MADSLGTIYAELRLRLDQFKQDIQTASTEIKELKNNVSDNMSAMSTVGGALKDVGKSMSKYVTAPIVAAGTASVYTFMQFEEAMAQVKAVGGMTSDELQRMTDLAMEMGAKTKFSAREAANAMYELVKLGFDANEMMTALPTTMDLAAAGDVGLAEAAVIVAQAMNMFNEEAEQTTRYADVFAKAAAMGALDVTTLGEALSYAGPSAAAMGYSLEETAAALAVLSDAGIDSTRAGTHFEALMRDMKKNAMENGGALTFLGKAGEEVAISLYDANGKIRPLVDIIRDLEIATEGMTDAQRDAALANVANTHGLRGLNVLLGKGADYLQTYTDEIYNSSGAGEEMARTMQDTLAGSLEQLGGALETAGIAIGEILAPVIRDIADGIKALVEWFESLSPTGKKVVVIVAAILAAIGPFLFAIGQFLAMIPAIATGFSIISTVAAPVILPILGIVAAIAAVIAIGVLLYKNWDKIKAWAIEIWGSIKDFFVGLWDGIKEWFLGIWNGIKDGVSNIWNGIKDTASQVWETITTGISDALNAIVTFFSELPARIWEWLVLAWENITTWVSDVWNSLTTGVSNALDAVVTFFSELPEKIWTWLSTVITNIAQWGSNLFNSARTAATELWDGFIGFIKDIPEKVVEIFTNVVNGIKNFGKKLWDGAKSIASNLWEGFKSGLGIHSPSYIEEAMFDIVDAGKWMLDSLKSDFRTLGNMKVNPPSLANMGSALKQGISEVSRFIGGGQQFAFASAVTGSTEQVVRHQHSGVLEIRGTNDEGQFVDAVRVVMDELRREVRT